MMRRNYTKLQLSSLGFSPSSFSHFLQVVPLQSLCTSTCCWRSREISPGRTHRRERSARTPKFHVPFSRQPAHLAWKHLPPRRLGKTHLLVVHTEKYYSISDSLASGRKKHLISGLFLLFCRAVHCTTQVQPLTHSLPCNNERRNLLVARMTRKTSLPVRVSLLFLCVVFFSSIFN